MNQTIKIPRHVAIIADGNRRWAKEKGLTSIQGYRQSAKTFDEIVQTLSELKVECLTIWIFSTENWNRDNTEISNVFNLAREYTSYYKKKCLENKIRFIHLGRKDRLPQDLVESLIEIEDKTKDYTSFTIAVAMDYGGHDEIIRTVNKLKDQNLDITEEAIENNLDTKILPRVDLIIRPGGEQRLSGFLSWQCAYAELYFTKKYFPDLNKEELNIAIKDYSARERRFGGDSKKS